ncbi:hypothetical protein EV424DRAFT_1391993 [Suillus variegatus]|nr:hypothetical protein EV424DRAFT_1391993 [Suillus variegatus]
MPEIFTEPLDSVIPDDLTLTQFFLDSHHPRRPVRTDAPWLIEDETGRRIGYEEIRARTFGFANGLALRYSIILIFSPNHVDYPPAIWATHRLGGIVSGANPTYTAEELSHQIQAVKATLIIAHPSSLHTALDAARASHIPSDRILTFGESTQPTVESIIQLGLSNEAAFVERRLKKGEGKTKIAFLNFSSGTTGKPKAVAIAHYAPYPQYTKVNETYTPWEEQRFRPGDIAAGDIYGLVFSVYAVPFFGMSLVVTPKFSFTDFLRSIERHHITHLTLVPPQIVLLCKHPAVNNYDLSAIRFLISGAAPLSAELVNQLMKVIPNAQIGQGYGLTESSTSLTMFSVDEKIGIPGGAGRFLPGIVARVVRPDGSLAGFDEPGELRVKTPSLATFVEGWLCTGDEVIIRKDKEVFIVDRLKEIMKVKGFQVAPAELEGCILDHPDVADTCVVPIPDDYSGEVPLAFVVLRASAANRMGKDSREVDKVKASIMKHVSDNKVAYKHLAGGVEFIDVIPKNPSGKLLRRVLRDRARQLKAGPELKAKL